MAEPGIARRRSTAQFCLWLLVQTIADTIVLWNGIPFYRRLLLAGQQFDPLLYLIAALCSIAGQVGYWSAMSIRHSVVLPRSTVASHILQFLARLNFIYASAMFSVVFFVKLDIRLGKIVLLIAVLFSMFCYSSQLKHVSRKWEPVSG
ncbi:hypothetical protein EJ069_14905 [Mesorhizobium sp. M2A.F.Ca.ET.043.05.1.1]|uniref:hypothetical protein n=1 Tax=Mesorhizobium sp. M2A.F.Ca.ET.043.05.1.1 TaxID=2493671 RepID=UPI000F75DB48|nr:hypothetical protein [Mesorhizobium sp. M2A.F.Ca.ET.043.05.1.1]AZO15893.1 hypothetical protein EJ069_14905 [Mesorhizobium sp. M2A.F.Ca.ET.043.05.1.1]